jgi:YD repeat-containing protein
LAARGHFRKPIGSGIECAKESNETEGMVTNVHFPTWRLASLVAAGIICTGGIAHAQSIFAYSYDALGRLVSVSYTNGAHGYMVTYSYDAAGNRVSVTTTAF